MNIARRLQELQKQNAKGTWLNKDIYRLLFNIAFCGKKRYNVWRAVCIKRCMHGSGRGGVRSEQIMLKPTPPTFINF